MRATPLALAFLAACSSVTTSHDFDPEADFSKLKSYTWWSESKGKPATSADEAGSPLVLDRVRRAADEHLSAAGFTRVQSNADFLIVARTGSRERTRVTESPSRYGGGTSVPGSWGYRYWDNRSVDVYQYEEGSLVLDVVDAKTNKLLWHGVARAVVPDRPKPEEITKLVNEAVAALLKDFPPRARD